MSEIVQVEIMKKKRVRFDDTYGEKYETAAWAVVRERPNEKLFVLPFDAPVAAGDRFVVGEKVFDVVSVSEDFGASTVRSFVEPNDIETSLLKFSKSGGAVEYGKAESIKKDMQAEAWMDSWVGSYARHIIENYPLIKGGKDIGGLFGICSLDTAAACVGAGPSLDKNIDGLRDFPGVIICADRAYRCLKARGINPDIVLSLDCREDVIAEMFDGPDSSGDLLVLNTCSDPKILKNWKGSVVWFNMRHPGVQFTDHVLPELFPGFGSLENMGNVGNGSVMLADHMGMKPIVLVGQDYGYTGGKMHADYYEFIDGKPSKKEVDHAALMEARTGKVMAGDVKTYAPFIGYARSLYAQRERRGLTITNCTEGGILTDLPSKPLAEMCGELRERIAVGKLKPAADAKKRIAQIKEDSHVRRNQ